jgi:hypothetical protein
VTICCKWATESGLVAEFGGKNAAESRDEIVFVKSVGVTSETNHGNSFGLANVIRCHDRFEARISR